MRLQTLTLSNGIRLIHHSVSSHVAHCGIFINAGSRDESEREHGLAHFIEHTIFKGTAKRSVFRVLNRLENVGADLDAYTTKEDTCINATFLSEYYDRTLELFSDIFFHSIFPEMELEREKQVVADEIRAYQDQPAEQIFDDFEDMIFAGHPLGRNILGTVKSLKKIGKTEILDFIRKNYALDQVVIASVGNIDFKRLVRLVSKYFSEQPERDAAPCRVPFSGYIPDVKEQKKKISQVHCLIGAPAYPFSDERRFPLALLNNMLGGPIMNSRLSLALRERNGLTYQNESNYTAHSDSGIISIYFGADPVHYEKALSITLKELKRLREEKLTTVQLHTIKKQLTGQLSIAGESNMAAMLAIGKSFLMQDRFDPIETIISRIGSVTADELLEIANEIFEEKRLSRLVYR
ncbi:MAG: pitrilysin family protein [Bacteroidota bacterium]